MSTMTCIYHGAGGERLRNWFLLPIVTADCVLVKPPKIEAEQEQSVQNDGRADSRSNTLKTFTKPGIIED